MKAFAIALVITGCSLFLRLPLTIALAQTTPAQGAPATTHQGEPAMPSADEFQMIKWAANESLAMVALFVGFLIWRRDLKAGLFNTRDQNKILIEALAENTKANSRQASAIERLAATVVNSSRCCPHCEQED